MKIRTGKNIYFTLTVFRLDNSPEDFTDARNIRMVINRKFSNYQFEPQLTIVDNVISFEFPASPLAAPGRYEMHLSYDKLNDQSVTGKDTYYLDYCEAFTIVSSTCEEDAETLAEVPTISLKGVIFRNMDGKDGVTPHIDPETKHWFIGFEDTGIVAEGENGLTPYIGENGNWFVGDTDTGKPSRGKAFEYSDFTPEQIGELQRPARDTIDDLTKLGVTLTDNEQERAENEKARKNAESLRDKFETQRLEAESIRNSNEGKRNSAEGLRSYTEQSRHEYEEIRRENENDRRLNENARNANEQQRYTAELERVAAEEERATEFAVLKTESETATQNAKDQADYAKDQGDYAAGTADGLTTLFNSYITDVAELFGKLAIQTGQHTDLKDLKNKGFFNAKGELIIRQEGSTVYQYIDVTKNTILRLKLLSMDNDTFGQLVLFDKNDNVLSVYSGAVDSRFIFTGVARIGICVWATAVPSTIVERIEVARSEDMCNRALYIAAGAVYNETTGFYELNGLTDITEDEMRTIYVQTHGMDLIENMDGAFANSKFRTNLGFERDPVQNNSKSFRFVYAFARNNKLEVLRLSVIDTSTIDTTLFMGALHGCAKLRSVIGILIVNGITAPNGFVNAFNYCWVLQDIKLRGLRVPLSIPDSPLLSLESLQYLIDNAANISAITVTLHPDVYAKIQDESNTEWHALLAAAQNKNIILATA